MSARNGSATASWPTGKCAAGIMVSSHHALARVQSLADGPASGPGANGGALRIFALQRRNGANIHGAGASAGHAAQCVAEYCPAKLAVARSLGKTHLVCCREVWVSVRGVLHVH